MPVPGCTLTLKVTPGAKKNEVIGILPDGTIRVKITAPPVEGKANILLVSWIAELIGIKSSKIEVVHGEKSRTKILRIDGISSEELMKVFFK